MYQGCICHEICSSIYLFIHKEKPTLLLAENFLKLLWYKAAFGVVNLRIAAMLGPAPQGITHHDISACTANRKHFVERSRMGAVHPRQMQSRHWRRGSLPVNILHVDRKSWVGEPGVLHPEGYSVVAAGGAEAMGVSAGHIKQRNTRNMLLHIYTLPTHPAPPRESAMDDRNRHH